MKKMIRKMNLVSLLALALLATAQPARAGDQEIELKGPMPLWKMLLTGEWREPAEIEKICTGSANDSELAKCLQAEIEAAEGGRAFLDLFGGILPTELSKNAHVGRRSAWVALGVATAGISAGYAGKRKMAGPKEFRLTGFLTSRGIFKAQDGDGPLYFKGTRTNDKTKYILIITAQ